MVDREKGTLEQLRTAIGAQDLPTVRHLIEAGADINSALNDQKWTPLHLAVEYELVDIVQWLLEYGADVGAQDASGFTPLHLAVDVEADGAIQQGDTPIPKISKLLLKYGANKDIQDNAGATPIALAEKYCYASFLELTRRR